MVNNSGLALGNEIVVWLLYIPSPKNCIERERTSAINHFFEEQWHRKAQARRPAAFSFVYAVIVKLQNRYEARNKRCINRTLKIGVTEAKM